MKKYPCIEQTIEVRIPNLKMEVRLWINQTTLDGDVKKAKVIADKIRAGAKEDWSNEALIKYIEKNVANVNAIQITDLGDEEDYGVVAYLVDFSADVHG